MDKKTIIAIVICVFILIFWGQIAEYVGLVDPAPPQEAPAETVSPTDTMTPPPQMQQQATQPQAMPGAEATTAGAAPSMAPIDTLIPEKTFTVTTPLYELTFSNYGGGLKKIVLREYTYQQNGNVILVETTDKVVPDFVTSGGSFSSAYLLFDCDQTGFELQKGSEPRAVKFVYDNGRGGQLIKTYTVGADSYDIGFDVSVDGIESFGFERSYQLVWGVSPAPTEKNVKDDYGYFKAVAMTDEHVEFDDFDNGVMSENLPAPTSWAGIRTKYFTAVMIPRTRAAAGIVATGIKREVSVGGKSVDARTISAGLDMPISNFGSVSDSYTIYAGPIHYQILKKYNVGLEELSSLGWVIIKPFSIAIIWLLPKIYSVISNYGVVVLIFALLVKIIIYPLSRKQTIAMAKMKDLQPKMKALQEKYKSDAGRLNKEMMKLYKEAGANPLSGCLPIIPQMPLFFALFTVFKTTIEFRGASFVGWITDLSVPDPYYILPIIMVVTMFFQQKMTMTDPKNKMMVYLMPLFFGWLFMNFPAGLVLYWTGFNVLSLFEIAFIRRKWMTPDAVVVEEKK